MKKAQHKHSVHLSDLTKCNRWEDVVTVFDAFQRFVSVLPSLEAKVLHSFRFTVGLYCPDYDFEADSIQRRIIAFFTEKYGDFDEFQVQEERRLFAGFQLACNDVFGSEWRKCPENLHQLFLLKQIKQFSNIPELLNCDGDILATALINRNVKFFRTICQYLEQAAEAPINIPSDSMLPELNGITEMCRNWTNPDFPLWLMQDRALQQAIEYLTGGQTVVDKALHQRMCRLGLARFKRKPIQSLDLEKTGGRYRFHGVKFGQYITNQMQGATIVPNYGENGKWIGGRAWRK